MKQLILKIIHFFKTEIWDIPLGELPRLRAAILKHLKILLLTFHNFTEDRCQLRASALTFYSLLATVPVIAMAFGIAKGFGFETMLQKQLQSALPEQKELLNQILSLANALLENTKGGIIAGIGLIALFWAVIKVLSHIERSFNDIWGIKKQRTLIRKFSDYLSLMLLGPILLFIASSVTVLITTQVKLVTQEIALLGYISPLITFLVKLIPYTMIWVLFIFTYIFMPNTQVKIKSGIVAGIIAGTIYQIVQWAYIKFQIGVSEYNAIYGSFAALPLFLIWLQTSWVIVLWGAEVSFVFQNFDVYERDPREAHVSFYVKKLLALQIVHLVIKNFSQGRAPLTAAQISHTLEIPIRLLRQILHDLVSAHIFSEIYTKEEKEVAYQPARDTDAFTIGYIVDALEKCGENNIQLSTPREMKRISASLQKFKTTIEKSPANKLLKKI